MATYRTSVHLLDDQDDTPLVDERFNNPRMISAGLQRQNARFLVDTEIREIGVQDLEIHPADLKDWLESDEVEPYWIEFCRSWLETDKSPVFDISPAGTFSGPSWQDYQRVKEWFDKNHLPSFHDVRVVIDNGIVREARGWDGPARYFGWEPWKHNSRLNKKTWWRELHWARFILQVWLRASHKTICSGDDVPAGRRELPSVWPAAGGSREDRHMMNLYRLLKCLALKYYLEKTDEEWAEKYRELGWDKPKVWREL